MDLSIVIVNYNVRYFIEQCLHSVSRAARNIGAEVFVVDNNSVDGSCAMIREKFPWVVLIENKSNAGFSRANNQAIKVSKGRFVLLLNPDTVVEEDTFEKCLAYMNSHPGAGALGVKMIDGTGKFLPESKRALPTPAVAFYKVFGLSVLFPHSRIFGRYHLGFLDPGKIHEIEILSGAFMFIRKEALDKTGLLDETFFMYGEDIDLSYRIMNAGYKNVYFPETTIIHYKGESTKKGSINYVLVFYRAMIIFARKHFSRKNARLFSILINMAIYFRASLSIVKRFITRIYQPLIDFILIFAGFYFLTPLWENFKYGSTHHFPPEFITYAVPLYILIWILSIFYSGGYEKPVRLWNILRGHITGTLIILVLYALTPENLRFSRALILLGGLWGMLVILLHRLIPNVFGVRDYEFYANRKKRIVLVGLPDEVRRVSNILTRTQIRPEIAGFVNPGKSTTGSDEFYLGNLEQLREIIRIHKVDEIVFCSGDLEARDIIRNMTRLTDVQVEYKIAPPESLSIIGSNSINTAGELYLIHFNSISRGKNRRNKRLFDILASLMIILFSPFLFPFFKKYSLFLKNAFNVLSGNKTWIGYSRKSDLSMLPRLREGVFEITSADGGETDDSRIEKLNLEYARDYKIAIDFTLLWKNLIRAGI